MPTSTQPTGNPITPEGAPSSCPNDVTIIAKESQPAAAPKDDIPAVVGPSAASKGKARAADNEDEMDAAVEPTGGDDDGDGEEEEGDDGNDGDRFEDEGKEEGNGGEADEEREDSDDEVQEIEPVQKKGKGKRATHSTPKWPMKTGPLSADALKEVHKFGDECRARSEVLAKKYGKTPGSILQSAGLGFRPSRAANPINDYSRWWAATNAEKMAGGM